MNDFLDRSERDEAIGVDLGGTNMRVALFRGLAGAAKRRADGGPLDLEEVKPVAQHREPVGEDRDPETMVRRLAEVIERLASEAGCGERLPIGIGFAGMLRGFEGMVANSPHLRWLDVPFGSMMRDRLGPDRPAWLYNDVNAVTYGEYAVGAAVGASDVLAVFVGTGIGGGMVAGHRLVQGSSHCAGEIGHTKVVWDESARQCACGLKGCVEAYVGGENLQRRVRAELAGGVRSAAVRLAGSPEAVNPGHVDQAALEGDDYALSLWAEIGPLLGVTLANSVTLLNPSHLVLGGGVLSRTPVLREHAIAAFEVAVNPPAHEALTVVDAALGDDAGVAGSALLALSDAAASR